MLSQKSANLNVYLNALSPESSFSFKRNSIVNNTDSVILTKPKKLLQVAYGHNLLKNIYMEANIRSNMISRCLHIFAFRWNPLSPKCELNN